MYNHETFSTEYPAISVWWGAVRTAGLAEGGRVGEDKEEGNMDEGRVDWIWRMMKAVIWTGYYW